MNYLHNLKMRKKLKGMPKVYYFNLDKDTERREFMETQFGKYSINYERVSQSCYVEDNFYDWVTKFEDYKNLIKIVEQRKSRRIKAPATFLRHMQFMIEWLESTDDNYLLIMEDDYDLSLIDYWHFDWNYLINHLPVDWDGFRLNNDHMSFIKFFLHSVPTVGFCNFGAMLYKREFVKTLVKMYCNEDGTIKSANKRSLNRKYSHDIEYYNIDSILPGVGKIYTAPLITTESRFCADDGSNSSIDVFRPIQQACHHWWRNERDLFTLEDFFTYSKDNDEEMTLYLGNQIV